MQILSALMAYLLGAIPFAYLIVRHVRGQDIRRLGSGNVGATNTLRTAGKGWGVLTLLLDAGKGFVAVALTRMLTGDEQVVLLAAVLAVVGHIFPVFLRFRGGKGVATGLGALLAVSPAAIGLSAVVFLLTAIVSRYVSLGSVLAAAAFPLAAWVLGEATPVVWTGLICSGLVIWRHSENIQRLLARKEHRMATQKK